MANMKKRKRIFQGEVNPKCKIKKGDEVIFIAGKEKGKRGTVLLVKPAVRMVKIEGLNLKFKHVKKQGVPSVERIEGFVDISNVALVNPATGMPARVGYKIDDNGNKQRYFKDKTKASVAA